MRNACNPTIAKSTPDLKDDLSEIEICMNSDRAEVVLTPKGHCEFASYGAARARGILKAMLRKQNALLAAEQRSKDLKIRVRQRKRI